MDEWNIEEPKKMLNNKLISKILIIAMIVLTIIILLILALLYTLKVNTVVLTVDGVSTNFSKNLIKNYGDTKYVNIKEIAKLLKVEYHAGEYKVFSSDKDKCYIQTSEETSSFYLNSDKINKIKVGDYENDYDVCTCSTNIIEIDGEFYAPIDGIEIGFDISFSMKNNDKKIEIVTLPTFVNIIEKSINNNGIYNSILKESFDNQKALLYGYIIASKKDTGLYSVTSIDGKSEIISDRYKMISFIESTNEFMVTNSIDKVGIIDSQGKNKIEQIYDSIKIINNNPKIYLTEIDKKFGVIDEYGNTIIYNEYDKIGLEKSYNDVQNQYVILNDIIPVKKDNKYGLFNLNGDKILDVKYDGIGCDVSSVTVENTNKSVTPVAIIPDYNGVVIKSEDKYDLFLIDINKIIQLKVESIYNIIQDGKSNYYMIYKEKELNLIENLIKLGYIESNDKTESKNILQENLENNNSITYNNLTNNTDVILNNIIALDQKNNVNQ